MRSIVAMLLACLSISALPSEAPPAPSTLKKPVTDEYHGVKIVDNYRWLENFDDKEVQKWSGLQNARSRAFLDGLDSRPMIYERLQALYSDKSITHFSLVFRGKTLFAMKAQPPRQQPFLVVLQSAADPASARVLVDPNQIDAKGSTAIDFYVPSLDGKLVAVSLSTGGSEEGTLHVFNTATGQQLSDILPRVNFPTAGGSVAWNADGSGLYYTRYPPKGERPEKDLNFYQQIYFHRLGTANDQDTYSTGKQFPRIAEIVLQTSDDGRHVLATVANGDGGEFLHFILLPSGKWKQITGFRDQVTLASFSADGALYMLSRASAPLGKLLRLTAPDFDLKEAKVAVAPSDSPIDGFVVTPSRMYVSYMVGGPSAIRVFDTQGKLLAALALKPVSAANQMVRLEGDEILYLERSYLTPAAWNRVTVKATDKSHSEVRKTALSSTVSVDFSDAEVLREFATSKDGTKVPLNILRRKGTKLDGNNPTILYGYGGYGINLSPSLSLRNRLWLDHGGVYVFANLRGGAEFGEPWHQQGKLTKKQNVFDDFIAAAEYLIQSKYTKRSKLAIEGGSNGGLLMGAALTQRPDLFRAVVSHVGIYDMLRVELHSNGAFNVTEFGTVKEADQFRALYAYSPYHHVKDGADYPAVLFLTGDHDGRVDPANSRKMTARLQAATHSGLPVLLRTSSSSGHGIGTALDERISQDADVLAFLFRELGMTQSRTPASGPRSQGAPK